MIDPNAPFLFPEDGISTDPRTMIARARASANWTVRAELAARAMQGLLADPSEMSYKRKQDENCAEATARLAVEHADALIKALNA